MDDASIGAIAEGLTFAPNNVEVRRTLDGTALERSANCAPVADVTLHRRAANG